MRFEDVDWLLKYPAEELVMSNETLNMINAALAASALQQPGGGVQYSSTMGGDGRWVRRPESIAGRKLSIAELTPGCVRFRVEDRDVAAVCFVTA